MSPMQLMEWDWRFRFSQTKFQTLTCNSTLTPPFVSAITWSWPVSHKDSSPLIYSDLDLLIETDVEAVQFEFGVNATMLVNFTDNPELEFMVSGNLGDLGDLSIYGSMIGTWDNLFGVKGVDISNVVLGVGEILSQIFMLTRVRIRPLSMCDTGMYPVIWSWLQSHHRRWDHRILWIR